MGVWWLHMITTRTVNSQTSFQKIPSILRVAQCMAMLLAIRVHFAQLGFSPMVRSIHRTAFRDVRSFRRVLIPSLDSFPEMEQSPSPVSPIPMGIIGLYWGD